MTNAGKAKIRVVLSNQQELMQDDLLSILDGLDDAALSAVCQVIVDRCAIIRNVLDEQMAEPIETHFIYPPIPVRDFDWVAYRDPEGKSGYGRSEDAAILDLLESEGMDAEEEELEPYECDCGCKYQEAVSVLVCRENNHGKEI